MSKFWMRSAGALFFSMALAFAGAAAAQSQKEGSKQLNATIKTNRGDIHIKLFPDQAPLTVANFVNLANRGYYDGLIFHRVLANFMIQGGCPQGTGTGGPGYKFKDEFSKDLRHSKAGILSMANSGPKTNGSQFFITHVPTPWLDDKHSIFGEVESAGDQTVVNAIKGKDKIESITIEGDASELLAKHADQLKKWNAILDKNYPSKK